MKVESLMSSKLYTCSPGDSLQAAATLMWEHDVGVVPVVDASGHLKGILTDRDIAMAAMLQGTALKDIPVAGTMTADVVTCAPGDDVADAERLMARHQVRRIPVVDAVNHVVGILSLNDLAAALSTRREPGVTASQVAQTLQAVCRRRQPVEAVAK